MGLTMTQSHQDSRYPMQFLEMRLFKVQDKILLYELSDRITRQWIADRCDIP
jgi:hypothetical protein